MSEPKTYCNAIIIKSKKFDDGGEILKASVKVDDLVAFLNQHAVNGWVNLDITRRREPSDKGVTHSVALNTYKPKEQASAPATTPAVATGGKLNALPF